MNENCIYSAVAPEDTSALVGMQLTFLGVVLSGAYAPPWIFARMRPWML